MSTPRRSGVLLHVCSLPGPYGVGDLGPEAYRFVDALERAEQGVWQVLPLVPTGLGDSPYASPSTFAGSPLYISPDALLDAGLLAPSDLDAYPTLPAEHVDYGRVGEAKRVLLDAAYRRFASGEGTVDRDAFAAFCAAEAGWLDDYALFMSLKDAHGGAVWTDWPRALAHREPAALARARTTHAASIEKRKFWQFLFHTQWQALRRYAHERDVYILGDLPIYVAHDSADVWASPELYHLDDDGAPTVVAGVPPDYFSETGQRWGNPIYRWDRMAESGFAWWIARMQRTLDQVDVVRLDHFRGFEAYWEIPGDAETAVDGRWVPGPGAALFEAFQRAFGDELPVVAENLGIITPEVTALMERFDLPGMAVLLFAFGGDARNEFLPHHHTPRTIAYTGTHDNDTVAGWWANPPAAQPPAEAARERRFAADYMGKGADEPAHRAMLRTLMASVAEIAVAPLQDVLGLGSEARMNTPGSEDGNWGWRAPAGALSRADETYLRTITRRYGRSKVADPHAPERKERPRRV